MERAISDTDLAEIRRLVLERETKKREMDALDLALKKAVGISTADRPDKSRRMSDSDFETLCGVKGGKRERISKTAGQALDCGLV
ncbi:MAG: hypothetical protein LBQ10_10680 [Desulfovibrio sp.]|jgi:hypothetical protein|nr:hypothetical protein [Desulfovibrio sp.]